MNKIKLNKEVAENLLNLLRDTVLSEGGDGDAMWYTRYFDLEEIKKFVQEYDGPKRWRVELTDDSISWGTGEEWVVITDSIDTFNSAPDWIQMKIKY